MQRYFATNFAKEFTMDEVSSKHIISVMRNELGDHLFICIDEVYYEYEIIEIDKKTVKVRLLKQHEINNETRVYTTLVIPILKKDNHKIAIQKAIELGVDEIILYQGDNSVVKWKDADKKIEKLEQFVVDSCRQSFRNKIIKLSYSKLNKIDISNYDFKLFGDETQKKISDLKIERDQRIIFISGCEGGFSEQEYQFFEKNSFEALSLAKTILRAETAPITFQSIVTFLDI